MQTRHFVVRTKVFGLRRGRCWRCMGQEVRWRGARAACLSAAMRVRCARRNTHTTDTQHQRHVVKYIRAQELWSRGLQAPLWSCRSRPVLRNLWPRAPPRSRGRRPQRAPLWSCRSRPVLRNPRLSAPPRSRGRRPTLRLLVPAVLRERHATTPDPLQEKEARCPTTAVYRCCTTEGHRQAAEQEEEEAEDGTRSTHHQGGASEQHSSGAGGWRQHRRGNDNAHRHVAYHGTYRSGLVI